MKMSLRTSTITSTVVKDKEKEKVPTTAKTKSAKGSVCEYAKCCKDFPGMNEVGKDELKKIAWETAICDATSPANMTAQYALEGKIYDLCGVHGQLLRLYEHGLSGEQKDNKHCDAPDEGGLDSKVDNSPSKALAKGLRGEFLVEPLSGTEITKGPAVKKPWSSDMSTADGDKYHNWSGTWRQAWLTKETLDNIQGRQVLNHKDASFRVVFFVHGYSADQSAAFITVPSVEAQCEVPRDILQGNEHSDWYSEPMLFTTLHQSTFVDGMSSTGSSMFMPTPVPTLSASIDELTAESPGTKDDDYKATSDVWKNAAGNFDEVSRGEQEGNSYGSPGRIDRRGAGTVPMRGSLLEHMNGGFKIGGQQVGSAYAWGEPEKSSESPNPDIRTPSSGMRGPRVETSTVQTGDLRGSGVVMSFVTGLLDAAAGSRTGDAEKQRDSLLKAYKCDRAGNGPGDDGDPSDGDDEDEDEQDDKVTSDMREMLKAIVALMKSDAYRQMELKRMKDQSMFEQANQDAFIHKATPIIAAAVTSLHELNAELARDQLAAQRQLKEEERAYLEKSEERKQDKALYPKANEVVMLARLIGDAGNNSKGCCELQINPVSVGSALYRELKVIANDPKAKEILRLSLTDSLIASIVGFKFGGAPKAGGTELVYAGGASIYDGLRLLTKTNDLTQRSFNSDPPKAGKLPVISDKARSEQRFKSIYEIRDAWRTLGTLVAGVFGPNWKEVFDACGAQMHHLYELDSDIFDEVLLKYLSDIGLQYWCEWMWRASTNAYLQLSDEEVALSVKMGFLEATALPGMMFGETCTFMHNNVIAPSISDNKLAMIEVLRQTSTVKRGVLGFSALPYGQHKAAVTVGAAPYSWRMSNTSVGGRGFSSEEPDDNSEEYVGGSYEVDATWGNEAEVGGEDLPDVHELQDFCQVCVGESVGGSTEVFDSRVRRGSTMNVYGKGHPKGGQKGSPSPGGNIKNRAVRDVKVPASIVKEAFGSLPYVTDQNGSRLGRVCFLSLCNRPKDATCSSACPSEMGHPNHRVGQLCNNIHLENNMKYENGFRGFTWAHFMISLLYRGFRPPIMVKAAPEDPSALQLLCNDAERRHRNGEAVPNSFLIQDQLVGAAPFADLMSYFSVGAEIDTSADCVGAPKVVSVLSSGARFSLFHRGATYTGVKSGEVRISGWPVFTIKDYGSVLQQRKNSCIFLAIGIAGIPFELDPLSYMKSVIIELSKPDIEETKLSDYSLLRHQVESESKILLTGLVHFGLPRHVAALVVQRSDNDEHRCVLFTCGQPKYVMVCYIEDNHIMPGVWADCPDGLMSYEQFERFWTPYTLSYPDHVKITHLGTVLATKFQFGDGPSGILVGGSNTATWDQVMLGVGRYPGCHLSQCERGCFNASHHTTSTTQPISFMSEPVGVDTSAMQLPESESEVTSGAAAFLATASTTSWGGVFPRSRGLEMAALGNGSASVREVGHWSSNASVGHANRGTWTARIISQRELVSETESDDDELDESKKKFAQTSHGFELKDDELDESKKKELKELKESKKKELKELKEFKKKEFKELRKQFAQSWYGFELRENYSEEEVELEEDAEEDELVWGSIVVGDSEEVRVLSDEEKELASSQAGNKRKRDLHEANEVAFMLRAGSPQVQELQPLVSQLKTEIANLKSAILDEATTGEIQKGVLQKAYLKASNALCHASVRLCKNRWWPQLFLTAFRSSHQGRVDPEVDPEAMKAVFEGLIPSEVLRTIVNQATRGEEVYLLRRPVHSWAQESPSVKEFKREIWASIWKDTAYGSTFVFGPECLVHMRLAEVQGYALHRVPKKSTATGAPTGAFRLIANLSHCDKEGHSMNNMTDVDYYGKFKMVKHSDIAQSVLVMRRMFRRTKLEISKWDTSRAFKRKYLSIAAFGLLGCKISGHTFLDQSEVFGHNTAPSTYAYSSEAIGQAHRATGMWLTAEELVHAGYDFAEGEEIGDRYIPFFSDTYCDDGVLVAPDIARYKKGCVESYTDFMKANLGSEAVSMKDPEEQEWNTEKTVIGLKFVLGDTPDARGDVDFLEPTPERIMRMKVLMDSEEFKPEGKRNLSAGLCSKAFSLWLWMCICCPRLKAFIGSFKRVFEGKVVGEQSDIVSPVRAGDNAEVAWQLFWDDMLTLRAILHLHEEKLGFFRVPLFRLLSEEEQLNGYPERFDTVSTDASFFGGGIFCHNGCNEGQFCRVRIPPHVINDLRDSMEHGHDFEDTSKYTIAIVEKTLHTLGLMVFGRRGRCYIMLQDNQNVVDWVTKGWGKPMRAQALLRRDVMHGMHLDIWSIIQYIHTTKNVFADLLSRSFDENGQDKEEVLNEFYKLAKMKHDNITEIEVSTELIAKLLPEKIECRDMENLLHDVFDAEKYIFGRGNSTVTCKTSAQPGTDMGTKLSWVSPLDDISKSRGLWQDTLVGGVKKYTENNWSTVANRSKSVFKDVAVHKDVTSVKKSARFEEDEGDVEDEEFEIEKVLKKRFHPVHGLQYKVNWKGYSHVHNRWMMEKDLAHSSEVIAVFEALVREKGMPKSDATDREADSFYYRTESKPMSAETVSKGPEAHRTWKRGQQDRPCAPEEEDSFENEELKLNNGEWLQCRQTVLEGKARDDLQETYLNIIGRERSRGREEGNRRQGQRDSYEPSQQSKGGGKGKGWMHSSHQETVRKEGYSRGSHNVESSTNYLSFERNFLGPSMSDKVNAAKSRNGRRVEVVIAWDDNRLVLAAARTLAESMAKNTTRTYAGNFDLFLGFCDRQNLSPVLNSIDKRKDEATLIAWMMYEFEIQRNKYGTLKGKLSAVRAAMMSEGYPNPLEGKYTLDRHMKGIKNIRGATEPKEPLPAEAFRNLLTRVLGEALIVRCTALAIVFAFFFLLRVSEFAARDKVYMEKFIALRKDVSFFKNGKLCAWNDPGANAIELFIKGSKTDQRHQGCRRMQHTSGEDVFCPVKVMQEWFRLTHGSAIPASAPLFSIPKGKIGSEWFVLTRDNVTLLMKGMAAEYNLRPEKIGTHSIRISGATALLLAGIPPATVQIIGRWVSNSFIGYQRYKAELMKGIADRMVRTHYATNIQKEMTSLE